MKTSLKLLSAALLAALALPALANGRHHDHDDDDRDTRKVKRAEALALVNGRIHTMDAKNRVVEEVLIENGRFVEVGRRVDRSGRVKVIDLRGRTVIPGIIDAHNHIVLVGNRPGWHTGMEHVFTIPDAVAAYRARVAELATAGVPADEFVTTIGPISAIQFLENRLPTCDEMNSISLTRPVYIQAAQGGSRANAAAAAWFTTNAPTVVVNPTTCAVTGPALQTLRQRFLTTETRKRSARDALQYFTALGITTHGDAGAFHSELPSNGIANENTYTMHFPFMELQRERKLPARLRIDFLHQDSATAEPPLPTLAPRLRNSFQFFGDDWMRTQGIGEFTGGGLAGLVAIGKAGWRGEDHSLSLNNFLGLVTLRQQAHDQLVAEGFPDGITKLRWRISHVPGTTPESVAQWKGLGGGLLVGWGPTRGAAANGQPIGPAYRSLYDSGIPLGWHSDGGDITVISPWLNFYSTITGKSLRGMHDATTPLANAGNTITRQETLRMATAANKWFTAENDLGSIEPGNHGDLVVLDRDFFDASRVPDADIPRIRSLLTVIGGQIRYDSGFFGKHKGHDDDDDDD
ncbi:MAG TPA: amidohydrolase family protein [Burkholderiales bacterium]